MVSPGTYWGEGNWNLELRGKAITVRSERGPEQTILDCQGQNQGSGKLSNRAFYIHQGEGTGTVIQGFTIRYGNIPGDDKLSETTPHEPNAENPVGGGIYCENAGPTIADCVIQASGAEFGGGIGCVNGTPTIVNCRISGCKAGGFGNAKSGGFGGAIALLRRSDATIRKCMISGNRAYYNGVGGGIYIRASSAQIKGCELRSNDADGNLKGGGIAVGGPYSKVTAENCVIASNTAQIGSGIWIDGRHDNYTGGLTGPVCEVLVTHCTVADNLLINGIPPYAGGIYASKADIRVRNCIVYGNGGQEVQIFDPVINTPVTYSDIKGGYAGAGNINVPPSVCANDGRRTDGLSPAIDGRPIRSENGTMGDRRQAQPVSLTREIFGMLTIWSRNPMGTASIWGLMATRRRPARAWEIWSIMLMGRTGNDKNDGLEP